MVSLDFLSEYTTLTFCLTFGVQSRSSLIRSNQVGFFKFTPPEEINYAIAALKHNFIQWSILDTDDDMRLRIRFADGAIGTVPPPDRRIYFADAEELAEQGVCDFLREISPVLSQEGVQIRSLSDEANWDGQGKYIYYVWVNEVRLQVFDEPQGEKDIWGLAHKRTVEIINRLLASAGSSERPMVRVLVMTLKLLF